MTTYNFTVINNDTYNGTTITLLNDTTPIDLTGATIELQARRKGTNELIWGIDTTDGITLSDPTNGVFTIDEQVIAATDGTFPYDVQITFIDGRIKTYISGEITILRDYTG